MVDMTNSSKMAKGTFCDQYFFDGDANMWHLVVDFTSIASQVQGFVVVVNGGLHDYQFGIQDIEVICAVKTPWHPRLDQNDHGTPCGS